LLQIDQTGGVDLTFVTSRIRRANVKSKTLPVSELLERDADSRIDGQAQAVSLSATKMDHQPEAVSADGCAAGHRHRRHDGCRSDAEAVEGRSY
jgi:hypothetical protein